MENTKNFCLTYKSYSNAGAATNGAIWDPGTGRSVYITGLHFTVSAAATVSITEGNDAATTRILYGDFAANSGISTTFTIPLKLAISSVLRITTSAGNVKVTAIGFEL